MAKTIIYKGNYPFRYYVQNLLIDEAYEVSEKEFWAVVGYDRSLVTMNYDKDNINRQNFFMDGVLIAYRERKLN